MVVREWTTGSSDFVLEHLRGRWTRGWVIDVEDM